MKTRKLKIENAVRLSPSVLDCDGPPPLATSEEPPFVLPSARRLAQSKTWRTLAAAFTFAILSAFTAHAQTFAIDRFVLSGGGGTSTNAQFNLTGTIGQPDAGAKLAGGSYTVEGGFWSAAVAVQMAGAPRLSVVRTGGNVIISWPSADSTGYVVEQTGTLAVPASWSTSGAALSDDGTTKSVTLPATPGYKFFRLRKP